MSQPMRKPKPRQAHPELTRALQLLAGTCDGAARLDGAGFNRNDADFGHKMSQLEELTPRQAHACWRMLRRYRVQLLGLGVDWEQLPEPELPDPEAEEREKRQGRVLQRSTQDPDFLVLRFPYDRSLVDSVKQAFEGGVRQFRKAPEPHWKVRLTPETVGAALALAQAWGFEVRAEVLELAKELEGRTADLREASRAEDSDLEIPGWTTDPKKQPYPFQRAAVAYADRALAPGKGVIFGDEMGLGKTPESLATLSIRDAFPALVVCPAALKYQWRDEVQTFLPGRRAAVLSGMRARPAELVTLLRDNDVLVINYDVLSAWKLALAEVEWGGVVCDEAHALKNRKAKRTEAAKLVCKGVPVVLFATGTLMLNRPQELIEPLTILGRLGDLGGFWTFAHRYCGAHQIPVTRKKRNRVTGRVETVRATAWDLSGATNRKELNEKLRGTCYVRRRKRDILADLPAKRRLEVTLELANRKEYDAAAADYLDWVGSRAAMDESFLLEIEELSPETQLERIRSRRRKLRERAEVAEQLTKLSALQRLCAEGKLPSVIEWVEGFLESSEEKLLLFAHHRLVTDAVAAHFGAPKITGATASAEKRHEAARAFQEDADCRLLVGQMQAAGVGLNLTATSHVAFAELALRPGDHFQAEDRCYGRMGDLHGATCWYLKAERSVDDWKWALLQRKAENLELVLDGESREGTDDAFVLEEFEELAGGAQLSTRERELSALSA